MVVLMAMGTWSYRSGHTNRDVGACHCDDDGFGIGLDGLDVRGDGLDVRGDGLDALQRLQQPAGSATLRQDTSRYARSQKYIKKNVLLIVVTSK